MKKNIKSFLCNTNAVISLTVFIFLILTFISAAPAAFAEEDSSNSANLEKFEVFNDDQAVLKVNEYSQIDAEKEIGYSAGTLNGLTALSMILDFHEVANSTCDMAAAIDGSETGVDIDGLVMAAKDMGFENSCHENGKDFDFIEKSIRDSKPFIVLLTEQETGYDFYVSVIGITKNTIIINNPISGTREDWSKEDFMKAWKDESCIAVIIE